MRSRVSSPSAPSGAEDGPSDANESVGPVFARDLKLGVASAGDDTDDQV